MRSHLSVLQFSDLESAIQLQQNLSQRLSLTWDDRPIRTIAGIDMNDRDDAIYAAIAVFRYPELIQLTTVTGVAPPGYRYVPGLLAFRMGPAILDACMKLQQAPDLIMVHGHGIAHPRGLGLASHLGLWLNLLAIGVARARLYGNHLEAGPNAGDWGELRDEETGERAIGAVLRTRTGIRPVYISPGHLIDLPHSIQFVMACCRTYRIP
jgi:deoxyribonuclease V